jgi:Fe2+ or Zn2+ uptake regulation protein
LRRLPVLSQWRDCADKESHMTVAENVKTVLQGASFSLTPAEIHTRLVEEGKSVNYHSIRRTVRELVASGAVVERASLGNSNTYAIA